MPWISPAYAVDTAHVGILGMAYAMSFAVKYEGAYSYMYPGKYMSESLRMDMWVLVYRLAI